MAVEIANFAGFSHAGTPVMVRWSRKMPAKQAANVTNMRIAVAVRGTLPVQALRISVEMRFREIIECSPRQHRISKVLTLSTCLCEDLYMPKKRRSYHHGNLRASLIEVGLRLIEEKGVRAFTLRELGDRAGVSRMAAYRHFKNKADLLGAISEAGFTQFADALEAARNGASDSFAARLAAMAQAYVRFATEHAAYFEVMFSRVDGAA